MVGFFICGSVRWVGERVGTWRGRGGWGVGEGLGWGVGGGQGRRLAITHHLTFLLLNLAQKVRGDVKGQRVTQAVDDDEGGRLLDPQSLHGCELVRPCRVDQVQDAQRAVCSTAKQQQQHSTGLRRP